MVLDILNAVLEARPDSVFVNSLLQQYRERGGLSKKQLEGLYHKAAKVDAISPGRLGTLEAIILKKHTRHRSAPPAPAPLYTRNKETGAMIDAILERYPAHKRVLFLKAKYDNNEPLSAAECSELQRFSKLLK